MLPFKKDMEPTPSNHGLLSRRDALKLAGCGLVALAAKDVINFFFSSDVDDLENRIPKSNFISRDYSAMNIRGEQVVIPDNISPQSVIVHNGKVKLSVATDEGEMFIDPLAITPLEVGEHPALRLQRLVTQEKLNISPDLQKSLMTTEFELFQEVTFPTSEESEARGTVVEIFPDKSFLVQLPSLPSEYRSQDGKFTVPIFFHVYPVGLDPEARKLASQIHNETLALSFRDQLDPPPTIMKKIYDAYLKSIAGRTSQILTDVNYNFLEKAKGLSIEEKARNIINGSSSSEITYLAEREPRNWDFFSGLALADRLRSAGVLLTPATAITESGPILMNGFIYLPIIDLLEQDLTRRTKFVKIHPSGQVETIYEAPGRMLSASPLPGDDSKLIISSDAFAREDPRFQATYLWDRKTQRYEVLNFPIKARIPKGETPINHQLYLYGRSPHFSPDGKSLYLLLYGFSDEGGGLWQVDLTNKDFPASIDSYRQVFALDHPRKIVPLNGSITRDLDDKPDINSTRVDVLVTAKEVEQDFSMSLSRARFSASKPDLIEWESLLTHMIGWNPDPLLLFKQNGSVNILVETYYNFEASIVPFSAFLVYRAKIN